MVDFTEMQKKCISFFENNIEEWLKDELKKNKHIVIHDEKIVGIYDTIGNAVDYAYENLEAGTYIIQEIIDENEVVSYLRLAVKE